MRGQDPVALRHRPLATVLLVELADHARNALALADPVEELLLHLVLDHLALFLDDQDLLQPLGERADCLRLERPHHAALEQANADLPAGLLVQSEVFQRLARVEICLAAGDDAEAGVRRIDRGVVELVGAAVGKRRIQLVVEQPRFHFERAVGPADVEPARRQHEVRRNHEVDALGIDHHRCRRFHHFGDRLHADPDAGIAAHREPVQAEVEVFLHRSRVQHRHHAGLEDVIGLVRQGRRLGAMVVACQRNDPAVGAGPGRVSVLEHVAAAVHARAFSVPHREDAVVLGAFEHVDLLRSPHAGGGEVLVQSGLEADVVSFKVLLRLPRRLVDAAQRRAAIAADEPCSIQPRQLIALPLQHRKPNQRLCAAHVRAAAVQCPFVVEGDLRQCTADGFG